MKIAILGSGGVGGYFGSRFALANNEVFFIARGNHYNEIKKKGLRVLSELGDVHLKNVLCYNNAKDIGEVDLVFVSVKLWSTEEAAISAKPLVGEKTMVISFQNGIVAEDILSKIFGSERVMGGVSKIAALIEEPGIIRHSSKFASLVFGELDGSSSQRGIEFEHICRNSNIDARFSYNIESEIWSKFILLVTMSSMTCLTRLPIGPIRNDEDTRSLMISMIKEIIKVAGAKNINLPKDMTVRITDALDALPEKMVASMCGDLRNGLKLELPWFAGEIKKLGKKFNIATPANDFAFSILKLHQNGKHPNLQF